MDFTNRIALITGATSGIARATALKLLEHNATVIINYRDPQDREDSNKALEEMRELVDGYGERALFMMADVTDEEQVKAMFEQIGARFGRLDCLANIAGRNGFAPIEAIEMEDFKSIFDINFFSRVLMTRYAVPLLKESAHPAIVNIASRMAIKPAPTASAYCAAEAATVMFTKSTAVELAKYGIRANTVSPGRTIEPDRELNGPLEAYAKQNPRGRVGYTQDVANAIAFLLSDEADHINGSDLAVNGGILLV
ncbi:MAG: SDR family oxidoreductase [Firmicutes bacterium]|nr:SDR family oxidoreductase [Bacillota bacterium]